jgi:hypothetical protein
MSLLSRVFRPLATTAVARTSGSKLSTMMTATPASQQLFKRLFTEGKPIKCKAAVAYNKGQGMYSSIFLANCNRKYLFSIRQVLSIHTHKF